MSALVVRSNAYREPQDYEKLGGMLMPMARPNMNHGKIANRVNYQFMNYFSGGAYEVFYEPDVFLGDDNVIPDIAVVGNPEIIKRDGIYGAPDIVVEVLSPSTRKRDMGYKKDLYEQSGVGEYWIVDTDSKSVDIYINDGQRYRLEVSCAIVPDYAIKRMTEEELAKVEYSFKSPKFSDMEVVLAELFEGIE